MKRIAAVLLSFALSTSAFGEEILDQPVREYYVFEVPGLAKVGPAFVSWFFIRGGTFWGFGETVKLGELDWPTWDVSQIPMSLTPVPKQKAFIEIYDAQKEPIQEIELKESFAPEAYFDAAKIKPAFYRIRASHARGHIQVTSPFYEWYRKKKIASCEVPAPKENFNARQSRQLKSCLATLEAYMGEDNQDTRQFYANIDWPQVSGRENVQAIRDFERELRSKARKRKMVFVANKTKGDRVLAEVGLTQSETLPKIGFDAKKIADLELASQSPDTKTVSRQMHAQSFPDGSGFMVTAYYSDANPERQMESPKIGQYQISLQLIEAADAGPEAPVKISQTRVLERRTGFLGYLRPLQALAFGGYNFLSSSPGGENNGFFGFPGLDLRYNWTKIGIQPYLVFEKDLLHLGSDLQITEVKFGAARRFHWLEGGYYSLGYQEYSLSGRNPGLTRLGGISALSLGVGASQRFESWLVREKAELLIGNAQSFDARLEAGKFFGRSSDSRYFVGPYLGFANYQGYVVDKLKTRRLYTEERLSIGVTIGWIGPDSF